MKTMLKQKTDEFQRSYLEDLLGQLTDRQRFVFREMVYPKGVSDELLADAIALCERTLGLHK